MMELARHALAALLILGGCAGGPRPSEGGAEAATNQAAAPVDETPRERAIRTTKAKHGECDALTDAIQEEQEERNILNVNDSTSLEAVANKLRAAAKHIDDVDLSLNHLGSLRAEYTRLSRAKADAMATAADADDATRRKAIEHYHELDRQAGESIDDINDYCGAQVSE